jgi:hypothetical protein
MLEVSSNSADAKNIEGKCAPHLKLQTDKAICQPATISDTFSPRGISLGSNFS